MTTQVADVKVRQASMDDMKQVAEIYAYYVEATTISFELVPPSATEMAARWEKVQSAGAPYLVAECDGVVIGFAYAGPYRSRPAYAHTVENSIYLAQGWGGRGVGRRLLDSLIQACAERGFHRMIAVIAGTDNIASIRLHEACGFVTAGRLREVGWKFDQWLDSTLMERGL